MKKALGGWSGLTRVLLHEIFVKSKVSTIGIRLRLSTEIVVKVSFWALLGDEEALAAMWHIKGASGLSPCGIMCSVTNKPCHTDVASGIASLSDRDPSIPNLACSDPSRLGLRTSQEVWDSFDALEGLGKEDREWWQHISGLKFQTSSILYDKPLREHVKPTESNRSDPMHVLLSNGLMGSEILLCLQVMRATIGAFFGELRAWHEEEGWLPKSVPVFSEARERNATNQIKANASEFLVAYPLLRWWLVTLYGDDAEELHVKSMLLLCDIVDIFRLFMHGADKTAAASLPTLVSQYLDAFVAAYTYMLLKFKHHQLMHLYGQIVLDELMLSCWVLERKHISTKQSVTHVKGKNVQIVRTALSRCLNHTVRKLEHPGWISSLVQPARDFPELAAHLHATKVEIARGMRWRGCSLKHGDVMFLDVDRSFLVAVVGCLSIDGTWALLLRQGKLQRKTKYFSQWEVDEAVVYHLLRPCDVVLPAAFHRYLGPQCLEVLH